jgi:type VI secretion system protein ImpC
MEFDYRFSRPQAARSTPRGEETPMRILVMGDFSGRGDRGVTEAGAALAQRPTVSVDVDNFEDVMNRLTPRLELPIGGPGGARVSIELNGLDDFHPDALYERLDVFRALRNMRGRLSDPATFAEAAAELRREVPPAPPAPAPGAAAADPAEAPREDAGASTFERLLGGPAGESSQARGEAAAQHAAQRAGVAELIKRIVEPHITPEADPQQEQFVASIDEATGEQMRSVLHHPAFQALESAWRGVNWLITGVETGEALTVHLLDVTKQELAADLASAGDDGQGSGLDRLLVEQSVGTPGSEPWSLLIGLYTFGADEHDVALLAALGAIASRAGGPFVAAADPRVLGCRSLVDTPDPNDWKQRDADADRRWQALRRCPAAPWIGLALPRLLLRLPYGSQTEAVERFDFEELSPWHDHEAYLWGNPALGCAMLVAAAFQDRGWSMEPGDLLDIDDLPAHTYKDAGESKMKPCAEILLSERAGATILGCGVMPLLSYRNRNAARLMRFQSLADPPAALSGPWG